MSLTFSFKSLPFSLESAGNLDPLAMVDHRQDRQHHHPQRLQCEPIQRRVNKHRQARATAWA
jgi:hypothetical protein